MDDNKLEFKNEVNDEFGNTLDSLTISNIMTYLYGEPKSIDRIASYLKLSPVKLQIYLNYLVDSNLIESFEEENGEMIEKKYRFCSNKQNVDVNIKIDSNVALLQYADEMCANLRKSILSLRGGDVNELSCYIGSVPEEALKGIISDIQRLQNEVEESEKTIDNVNTAEKYMLLTVFVPYKELDHE